MLRVEGLEVRSRLSSRWTVKGREVPTKSRVSQLNLQRAYLARILNNFWVSKL